MCCSPERANDVEATLLPNIFNFAMAAPAMTAPNAGLRASLGLAGQAGVPAATND